MSQSVGQPHHDSEPDATAARGGSGRAPLPPGGDLMRDRRARERNAEDRELAGSRREEREGRDVERALVEHQARRRRERIVPNVAAVASGELAGGRYDLDLVGRGLIRADVEGAL